MSKRVAVVLVSSVVILLLAFAGSYVAKSSREASARRAYIEGARRALESLKSLKETCSLGLSYERYSSQLASSKTVVDAYLKIPNPNFAPLEVKKGIGQARNYYLLANDFWYRRLRQSSAFFLDGQNRLAPEMSKIHPEWVELVREMGGETHTAGVTEWNAEICVQAAWSLAGSAISEADKNLRECE